MLAGDLNDDPGSPPLRALEGDAQLERIGLDLPLGTAWTFRYQGRNILIDYILRARGAAGAYVPGSARTHHEHTGRPGSDHAALSARFDLPR